MMKSKDDRLIEIKNILENSTVPVSGTELAKTFQVSRQVIVQDIGLLRAQNIDILSTQRGYCMNHSNRYKRIFKVYHHDDEIVEEMNSIVDLGAKIDDVFIEHRIYGKIICEMNIKSRKDVEKFMENIYNSVSTPLKNITNNYHFHTISAEDEETLDQVETMLEEKNLLVKE